MLPAPTLSALLALVPCGQKSTSPVDGVLEDLARREYQFQPVTVEGEVWSAPNRSHGLRCRVSKRGFEIYPRAASSSADDAPWILSVRTTSFGRTGELEALCSPSMSVGGNRASFDYELLEEWYENRPDGIEQGWTIPERAPGTGPLWIGLELRTGLLASIAPDAASLEFRDAGGAVRLAVSDLAAYDADGSRLRARFLDTLDGFGIAIDDSRAVYPLIVDPIYGDEDWKTEGNQSGARLGQSVASAGDVNGDGFGDVIVGARNYDLGENSEGAAMVYLGSSTGLANTPAWTGQINHPFAHFGTYVAGAGDVNNDGYDDVIVGAPGFYDGTHPAGLVYLFLSSATGLPSAPSWTSERGFGVDSSASTAGDVNGDGYDDVILGHPYYENGEPTEGRACVYLGSPSGLPAIPDWTAECNEHGCMFGISVASAGDVNGDGFDDVIVGAENYESIPSLFDEGGAFVYLGSAGGLPAAPDWIATGGDDHAHFGHSVSTAGDANDDGYDDVIIGAFAFSDGQSNEGTVAVFHGSASGLPGAPSWTVECDQQDAHLGSSAASVGDFNADGYSDVIVSAPQFDDDEVDEGLVLVFLGSADGITRGVAWTITGDRNGAESEFGRCVSSAGDVDGDGFSDLIIGDPRYGDGQSQEGAAFVFHGHACVEFCDRYCTSTPNSTGSPALISASGSSRSSDGALLLTAAPVPNQFGIFFHGTVRVQHPFGNGYLCAAGQVRGELIHVSGNVATYAYDNTVPKRSLASYLAFRGFFERVHVA